MFPVYLFNETDLSIYIYSESTWKNIIHKMSYTNDYSFCYSSGDDSFSYISDLSTSYYRPLHQLYPFYFQISTPQHQQQYQQQGGQVNHLLTSSPVFQIRPKKKENRRFTEEQIRILEEHFYRVDKYVSKVTIDELSNRTQLKPSQIRVWFNNKRIREHH